MRKIMRYQKLVIIILLMICDLHLQAQDKFPYTWNASDFIIFPATTGAFIGGRHLLSETKRNLTIPEIERLNRNDINSFDRFATYQWNRSADKFSNMALKSLLWVPVAIIVPHVAKRQWTASATVGLMYVEVIFLTKGVTDITKALVQRTRPYLYNTALSINERFTAQGDDAPIGNTSFFSGHTSSAFAGAVLLSKMFTDIYGGGGWSAVIWSSSLILASTTAYARVAAGEHFPTDVIVGAVVGSAIGYGIPALHKSRNKNLNMAFFPGYFRISYHF